MRTGLAVYLFRTERDVVKTPGMIHPPECERLNE
jgi:hypothetical protein